MEPCIFFSQNSQHLIFGLGTSTMVDSIIVTFPSGLKTKEFNVLGNTSIVIQEVASVQVSLGATNVQACPGDTFYPMLVFL